MSTCITANLRFLRTELEPDRTTFVFEMKLGARVTEVKVYAERELDEDEVDRVLREIVEGLDS